MFPPLKSLKSRLTLWVFLPTILISAVDLIVTYSSTDNIATLVQQQLLKGSAKIISEQLSKVDGGYEISIPPSAFELFANEYKDRVYYSVRSKEGRLIAGDEELAVHQPDVRIEQEKYYITQIRGEPVRVITYAHTLPSTKSNDYAVTQVAQTLTSHDAFKKDLFLLTIREHLILLSIVLIGLIIAFRWTLSPLIRFGEKLLERQPGSLEKLDENEAPAELKPVIFAMNDYVTRLDKTLSSYEQFVANTAHQLRTSFAIVTSQINFGNGYVLNAYANTANATQTATGKRKTWYGSVFYHYDKRTELYFALDRLSTDGTYLAAQANGFTSQNEAAVGMRFKF